MEHHNDEAGVEPLVQQAWTPLTPLGITRNQHWMQIMLGCIAHEVRRPASDLSQQMVTFETIHVWFQEMYQRVGGSSNQASIIIMTMIPRGFLAMAFLMMISACSCEDRSGYKTCATRKRMTHYGLSSCSVQSKAEVVDVWWICVHNRREPSLAH